MIILLLVAGSQLVRAEEGMWIPLLIDDYQIGPMKEAGLNFDREWEGTMSDLFYDPNLCRNIAVDMRYVLFIIDKYAGAGYLLDEMDIIFKPE